MNMIASVLHLDRTAIRALRITDPYSLHRVVYGLYEDVRTSEVKCASQSSGILYADLGGDIRGRKVLLLADRKPADCIEGQFGQVESKQVPDSFLKFHQYRFQVIVNPTRRNSSTRKLVPVRGRDNIAGWFADRAAASWGFQVGLESLTVEKVEVLRFTGKNQNPLTIAQAHIQGNMTVHDSDGFRHSFTRGIGRARAFGCGLLQIQPLSHGTI